MSKTKIKNFYINSFFHKISTNDEYTRHVGKKLHFLLNKIEESVVWKKAR